MRPSDSLFHVIHSLSKSEKRYFKLFVDLHKGEKNYLRLFDEIGRMHRYDEDKLKERLKDAPFINDLHVTKNYLYRWILKAMRAYSEQKSSKAKLFNLIRDAEFLQRKGLMDQAQKVLTQARKLAGRMEDHVMMIEIIRREVTNVIELNGTNLEEQVLALQREAHGLALIIEKEQEYLELEKRLFIHHRKENQLRDEDLQRRIQHWVNEPHIMDSTKGTFMIRHLYHNIHALYHRLNRNLEQSHYHYRKVHETWEEYPAQQAETPYLFKIHLSNFLNSCHNVKEYEAFPALLTKVKAIPDRTFNEAGETFQNVYFLELLYYMNTNRWDEALALEAEISRGMEKYRDKVNTARELAFCYNLCVLFWVTGEFKRGLSWLNRILTQTKTEHRMDIQRFARVMALIFHFELAHHDLMENLHLSATRYLKRRDKLYPFEAKALYFLRKLPELNEKDALRKWWDDFAEAVKVLRREQGTVLLGMEELELWIQSKVRNCKMTDLL